MKASGYAAVAVNIGASLSLALGMFALAPSVFGQTGTPSGNQTNPAPPHPTRVRVKLDGFDLSQQAARSNQTGVASLGAPRHTSANQIGGASRGIGAVRLYAPDKALAYSLTPTFQWNGSPGTQYKFKIEDLAEQTSFEAAVVGSSFTYPQSAPALKPGSTYSWMVQPDVDIMGGASNPALIVIAGGPERDKIEDALAAIPQTGDEGARATAKVFFDQRIWYDATHDYSTLIALHPDDAELHRMRGALYDQVPATERLADADFASVTPK